ncbi:hypothetical protein [Microbacterium sp. A93]|uniref:hypothetical protein n=1 Tax=Microbacterium sp. A93 TaxID=3450716 RepID=UPI003F6DACFB
MIDEPMTVVNAADRDARSRRRTWVTGGALLLLTALVGFVARFDLAQFHYWNDVFWAVGVLVLVIGFGRAGSITGRRPLATIVTVLQLVFASPLAAGYLSSLVPSDPGNPYAEEDAWIAVMFPYFAVVLVLTVAAVILIGIANALPRHWSWAPALVLAASAASSAALSLFSAGDGTLGIVTRMLYEVPGVGIALLGALAIVLGLRAKRTR